MNRGDPSDRFVYGERDHGRFRLHVLDSSGCSSNASILPQLMTWWCHVRGRYDDVLGDSLQFANRLPVNLCVGDDGRHVITRMSATVGSDLGEVVEEIHDDRIALLWRGISPGAFQDHPHQTALG